MRYLSILLTSLSALCLNSCEKHLISANYSLPVLSQTELQQDITDVKDQTEPAEYPELWDFIPTDSRENIFESLLGDNNDVYFETTNKGETFAAFDPKNNALQALAQVRKVGNEDGFVLVFAGIDCQSRPPVISGVYSFEYGEPMPGIDIYSQKKDGFLHKFTGISASEKFKVDTITGATMICDPLGKEINDISKELLEINNNAENVKLLLNNGKKMPDHLVSEPVADKSLATEPVKDQPVVNNANTSISVKSNKIGNKKPGIEKQLANNASTVATIEIVLISLGTGIIIGTSATNRRAK